MLPPLPLQTKPTLLRRWAVRVSALLTIIGTLLILLNEQPCPSIRDLQPHRLPSILGSYGFGLISTRVSSFSTEPSSDSKPRTPGYMFSIPDGRSPAIYDQDGELIWQERRNVPTQNLRVQTFRGQDYLTYWTKEPFGPGRYAMLDSSYTERFIVTPVGMVIDSLHDFTVTRHDTALIAAHYKRRADLSAIGGAVDGWILDGIFQEIDIVTGTLLYEWRAAEHVPIPNTLKALDNGEGTEDQPFDYFHLSGVDQGPSGDYLVSAGHMRSVMSVDASTGQVQWNLGGRANDFRGFDGRPIVDFTWPHNARWSENGTIMVMDKGGSAAGRSRGMTIQINPHTSQAVLRQVYRGPVEPKEPSDGDMQISQDTGNVLISWGGGCGLSEFTADGKLLSENHVRDPPSGVSFLRTVTPSRVSKHTWTGKPLTKPTAKTSRHGLQVHWNGATEVVEWQLDFKEPRLSSQADDSYPYHGIGRFKKTGFETLLGVPPLKGRTRYFLRVAAIDQQGQVLGYTDDVEWQQAWTGSELSQSQFRVLAGVCLFGALLTLLSTLHICLKSGRERTVLLLPLHKS
ncbi:hypothetical protein TMatcc_009061 [Talaromyces marneffei ATCC 18224]|uniref:Arylsulfotransferase n=1 Tax=Talaromyces marneffei (strain ATCC 18224 / CBS 334.59 / QM 7333) TaxID=441960 RepID=B6QNN1_TALMQ|nr:conserved hypothetical protein [Talaromyces marneffei ATCC 18224]